MVGRKQTVIVVEVTMITSNLFDESDGAGFRCAAEKQIDWRNGQ